MKQRQPSLSTTDKTTATTTSRGACGVWPLLWCAAGSGHKLSLNIADVCLFDSSGLPEMWLFTAKNGQVKRKSRDTLTTKTLYRHFSNLSSPDLVAFAHLEDGTIENVSNDRLEELLLRGPLISRWRWKTNLRVEALRAYIPPKGGYGSGFRNCYKFAGKAEKPITSTQRLLALDHEVSSNRRANYRSQKSQMTKMNKQLDLLTVLIVNFIRTSRNISGAVLFLEVEYCIDAADKIWFIQALQLVASATEGSEKGKSMYVREQEQLQLKQLQEEKRLKKRQQQRQKQQQPQFEDSKLTVNEPVLGELKEDTLAELPNRFTSSLSNLHRISGGSAPSMATSRSHWSLKSGVAVSPSMSKNSRHQDPEGVYLCPGVFCGFCDRGAEADEKRVKNIWTTDKAMQRERDALQETIKSYRRTMAKTSALSRSMQKTISGSTLSLNGNGPKGGSIELEFEGGDIRIKSMLHVYEKGHSDVMSPALFQWCQAREELHESVCAALQVSEPAVGQTIVLCEPIFIRWSNHPSSSLSGKPVTHVNLYLFCGNARTTVICHRLPNEGVCSGTGV